MSRRGSRRRGQQRWRLALGVCVGLLLLGGGWWYLGERQGQGQAAALASAREHLARHAPGKAIPLLRAVVQTQPKDGVARELLGQALLQAGDAAAALKELRRALSLGRDSIDNRLAIARAHLLRGEFDDAQARLASARAEDNPDWQLLSGDVLAARGAAEDALPFYRRAVELQPDHLDAYLGQARAEMASGKLDAAAETLSRALARDLAETGLWLVQGQLALAQRKHADALAAFSKVLAGEPAHELALLGAASAELGEARYDAAAKTLDRLSEPAQAGPRALFLRAMVATGQRDARAALNYLRRVLAAAPEHRDSLRHAARLHFQLAEYGDAEHMLRRLLKLEPDDASTLRMLEAAQLAAGRFDAAAYDFDALDHAAGQDPRMLTLLGAALLRGGDVDGSARALDAAQQRDPASLAVARQLLMTRLAARRFDDVITQAPALRDKGDTTLAPDVLVVAAHLGKRDVAAARTAAEALMTRHAGDALAYNVLAFVQEAAGDVAAARDTYQRTLDIAPDFDAAHLNLARLDISDGNPDAARAQFEAVLAKQPDHPQALDGLAMLALADKNPARAVELWQQARRANPDAVRPRLLLSRHAREDGRAQEAIDFAREAWQIAPYAPGVQLEYCMSLLAGNRNDDALPLARALAKRYPDDGKLTRLLAIALARNGDSAGLRDVLAHMIEAAPGNLDARVALARLALQQRRSSEVAKLADEIAGLPAGAPVADELRGDAALQQEDPAAAAAAYARAHAVQPTRSLVLKLDAAEQATGKHGGRLAAWLEQHPDDLQVRAVYAGQLQKAGDDAAAVAEFERVLAAAPDSAVVRNNLAWLYRKLGDGRALDMAQQAYELAPRRAEITDTYGWILFEQGRHEQALKILEQAHELAPGNPDIRFHRASALARMGRQDEALKELEALLRESTEFESRALAEQLQFELQS